MKQQYETAIQRTINVFDSKTYPVFKRMRAKSFSQNTAEKLAKKYYPVNLAFSKFLAAAISHIDGEATRILLVQNLYEEHGNLDLHKTHTELFRIFMRALNLTPERYANASKGSAEDKLLKVYNKACYEGPGYRGLAVLFAFEKLFSPFCTILANKFKESKILSTKELIFFEEHGEVDIIHAQKLKEALLANIHTRKELEDSLKLVHQGADLLCKLFDEIIS